MLDQDDLKWIATTSTELNSMLQQIARYADLARQNKGDHSYVEILGDRVDLATKTAQDLFDRVTSRILEGSTAKAKLAPDPSRPPEFKVVRSASEPAPKILTPADKPATRSKDGEPKKTTPKAPAIPPEISVLNPNGNLELILLVDDEMEIAELASAMLTDEGYRVILARDGFQALKIYQQISTQIGLIILDFFLPVMDGDAVFDELRALNPEVVVVLSSGFSGTEQTRGDAGAGPQRFHPETLHGRKTSRTSPFDD